MERPPVDGAEVFGANMAIGMFKYHALRETTTFLSCRRAADKICGVAERVFPPPEITNVGRSSVTKMMRRLSVV